MRAIIRDVEYVLPERDLTNEALTGMFPDWPVEKIARMTGIRHRRISGPDEFTSDLAVRAAEKLFSKGGVGANDIDALMLCTMTPDYQFPATACLVQTRLGLPKTCNAFDLSMGCTGYIYGLGLAKGLIETGQVRNLLFITSDTLTKILRPDDKGTRTIFGDGAAATWLTGVPGDADFIGPFDYGTSGSIKTMAAVAGGMRGSARRLAGIPWATEDYAFMDGPEVLNFTIDVVPGAVTRALDRAGLRLEDIDLFVFHQANKYMMEYLRQKMGIPKERFSVQIDFSGNTVSSTIPIALTAEREAGRLKDGMRLLLVGFGVGHSWATTVVRWSTT
ncbi:MAG: ketoacyl-ACP synthase III [bacterium]